MSGEQTCRRLKAEREEQIVAQARIHAANELAAEHKALRADREAARMEMIRAGFEIREHANAEDMVTHLLKRNQDQKTLEDGLRERLKAAEKKRGQWKQRALAAERWIKRKSWITGDVYDVNTERGVECPFHITVGGCSARRSEENGDWCRCAEEPRSEDFPEQYPARPPCRLDEGPILVKKAEEDSGSAADGAGRPPQQPVAGGDRSNDPESPR